MSDELHAIQLYLHPTRREALTATEKAITRWSLETNLATILAQFHTAPESLFSFSYSASAQVLACGGITGSPDGLVFAHEQLGKNGFRGGTPSIIEWRRWDNLSIARSTLLLGMSGEFGSLACSPDGRWLVLDNAERIFLLDWQAGKVLSHHYIDASFASGLAFDTTSTFVAGVVYNDGLFFQLWRLGPADEFIPRPPTERWPKHLAVGQDEVIGNSALTLIYTDWNRLGFEWPNRYLADAPGWVAFSPNSSKVIFSLNASSTPYDSTSCFELVSFEVPSGKLLWSAHNAVEATGQAIFSPDSSILLIPELGGDLLVYRAEDGTLVQRLPTGLSEPIQALAFDHDGKTLWLATEEKLVQYQPKG